MYVLAIFLLPFFRTIVIPEFEIPDELAIDLLLAANFLEL